MSGEELANEFADFFLMKIDKIRQQFKDIPAYSSEDRDMPRLRRFSPMTETEAKKVINSMHSKSCELDPIPTNLLKLLIDKCLPHITEIVNVSLTTGKFSEKWKTSVVRPLIKKLGLDLINTSYRPVSNLSFFSKLVEKCALLQFNEHCDQYGLMPDFQSAYRAGYSTETALIKLANDILWAIENQRVTVVVLLDLSAAFDTVDHSLMLIIFHDSFGISDTALQWYNSYLRPNSMKVCVNTSYSSVLNIKYGVPQGSCSGANNFKAHCSPISDIVKPDISLSGYADDHSLHKDFKASNREDELTARFAVSGAVSDISAWMSEMHLKLNCDKTELILFGRKPQLEKCTTTSMRLDGNLICVCNEVKYLGGGLDSNLTFKKHVSDACRKAMANFIHIRHIR